MKLIDALRLIIIIAKRDVKVRYKGSVLGLMWPIFQPLMMLSVYSLVFSGIFKVRWPGSDESTAYFSVALFAGLSFFNFFSEVTTSACGLIQSNKNYVKKIVFPIELFAYTNVAVGLFHYSVSLLVWLLFYMAVVGVPNLNILLLPAVLLPAIITLTGVSWFLSSMCVYLRDLATLTNIAISLFLFLTPIFYPLSALSIKAQKFALINPIAYQVEMVRNLLMHGVLPSLVMYCNSIVVALIVLLIGRYVFEKLRNGFAEVL